MYLSFIFVGATFRELTEAEIFVDILIRGLDASLVMYSFCCAPNFDWSD